MPKATDLLKRQHREVATLFKKAESAGAADERRELCEQIAQHLEQHTQLEEQLFYPALDQGGPKKAHELVLESLEEHHVVKLVLEELPQIDFDDEERFHAKLTVLKELVQHHVEEEEKEMFRFAEKLGKDEQRALGEQLQEQAANGGA